MTRWVAFAIGIVAAAVALYAVLAGAPRPGAHDEIDAASRARLERLLERIEQGGTRR